MFGVGWWVMWRRGGEGVRWVVGVEEGGVRRGGERGEECMRGVRSV